MASRNQPLEDGGEFLRDLLECALDRLVLDLVKMGNELLDRGLGLVELFPPLQKLLLLGYKVVVLLEGLLVDVRKFLQPFIDAMELLDKLWQRMIRTNNVVQLQK